MSRKKGGPNSSTFVSKNSTLQSQNSMNSSSMMPPSSAPFLAMSAAKDDESLRIKGINRTNEKSSRIDEE